MNFVSNDNSTSLFTEIGNRLRKRPSTFTGTTAEWNALTSSEKEQYEIVNITDDYSPSSGGGHTIQDADGTDMSQRDTLQFKGGLRATDDSTNGKTIIDDTPVYYTWEQWNAMTPEQQRSVAKGIVTGTPDTPIGGGWNPHFVIPSDTGETVTVVKGQTTITAIETSEGIYECDIPNNNYGDWTVNGIVDGISKQKVVPVNVVQIYFINYINGRTVTPVNDIDTLLKCADIYNAEGIETISDVLADDTILSTVVNSNNAIDYLVRSTDWVSSVISNLSAAQYIGLNDYASTTLLCDITWCDAICDSANMEYILNYKVPTMTSNNTPIGVASATGLSYGTAFNAFDETNTTIRVGYSATGTVTYQFYAPFSIRRAYLKAYINQYDSNGRMNYTYIDGSNDGTVWERIGSFGLTVSNNGTTKTVKNLNLDDIHYTYIRVTFSSNDKAYGGLYNLQLWGRINYGGSHDV